MLRRVGPSVSGDSLTWIVINNNIRSIYADSIRTFIPGKLCLASLILSYLSKAAVGIVGAERIPSLRGHLLQCNTFIN